MIIDLRDYLEAMHGVQGYDKKNMHGSNKVSTLLHLDQLRLHGAVANSGSWLSHASMLLLSD